METNNTITIKFNAEELDTIYSALNRLAIHYSEKSETMQKILSGTSTIDDIINPDYFFLLHDFVANIQDRVYKAEKRLEKKNA